MHVSIRSIERDDIERIREIDRSEVVDFIYYYRNGKFALEKEHYDIRGWAPGMLEELQNLHDRGGTIFGAFDDSSLVGVAALESTCIGSNRDTLQLAFLHINKDYRRKRHR